MVNAELMAKLNITTRLLRNGKNTGSETMGTASLAELWDGQVKLDLSIQLTLLTIYHTTVNQHARRSRQVAPDLLLILQKKEILTDKEEMDLKAVQVRRPNSLT
eukprot:GHVN01001498.1.p4 GENE.GHVN01001498.1~~GHVN01001498.1.p4  ORF type:complete len:104 (+),score=15.68 GHVN01001498.1:214-525(+)